MGERLRAVGLVVAFTASGAIAGDSLDAVFPNGVHADSFDVEPQSLGVLQGRYSDAVADAETARDNFAQEEAEYTSDGTAGALCMDAIEPYRQGGKYWQVRTDGAVLDVVVDFGEEPPRCGDDPVYVRSVVEWVRGREREITGAEAEADYLLGQVEKYQEYEQDDEKFSGANAGAITGLMVGIWVYPTILTSMLRGRRRKERSQNIEDAGSVNLSGPLTDPRPAHGGPRPTPRPRLKV